MESGARRGGLLRATGVVSQQVRASDAHGTEGSAFDVRMIKTQGVVREIEITCACGQHLVLVCEYSEDVVLPTDQKVMKSEKQS